MPKFPNTGSRVQVAPGATYPGLPPVGTIGRVVGDAYGGDPIEVKFPGMDTMLVPLSQLTPL